MMGMPTKERHALRSTTAGQVLPRVKEIRLKARKRARVVEALEPIFSNPSLIVVKYCWFSQEGRLLLCNVLEEVEGFYSEQGGPTFLVVAAMMELGRGDGGGADGPMAPLCFENLNSQYVNMRGKQNWSPNLYFIELII